MPRLLDDASGRLLIENVKIAGDFWSKTKGLLGRKELPTNEGLLLKGCRSIHMFFMGFAIDAVFLGEDLTVVKIGSDLQPWRLAGSLTAAHTLEISAGSARRLGLSVGMRLRLE